MTDPTTTPETEPNAPTEASPTPPNRRTRGREKRELMCPLTKPELRERGARMARVELEVLDLDAELEQHKMRARLVNAKIDDLADERTKLARAIDSKQEPRVIECEWVESAEQNAWLLMRLDTQVQIDIRPITVSERQLGLALEQPVPIDDGDGDEPAEPERKRKPRATNTNGKTKHEH